MGLILLVLFLLLQEAEYEAPRGRWVEATDGSLLLMIPVDGEWGACRRNTEWFEQASLKRGSEDWDGKMDEEEALNRCVTTAEGDLVLVGPSDLPGALAVSFRDRKDVHRGLAWYIDCRAVPEADGLCFHDD